MPRPFVRSSLRSTSVQTIHPHRSLASRQLCLMRARPRSHQPRPTHCPLRKEGHRHRLRSEKADAHQKSCAKGRIWHRGNRQPGTIDRGSALERPEDQSRLPPGRRACTCDPYYRYSSAEATRELFEQLRAGYDYIIVDLPPLAPVVDVRATSMLIDRFVLVVQWGQSKIDTVQHALHVAPHMLERMMGVVLNKTDIKEMARWGIHTRATIIATSTTLFTAYRMPASA